MIRIDKLKKNSKKKIPQINKKKSSKNKAKNYPWRKQKQRSDAQMQHGGKPLDGGNAEENQGLD